MIDIDRHDRGEEAAGGMLLRMCSVKCTEAGDCTFLIAARMPLQISSPWITIS